MGSYNTSSEKDRQDNDQNKKDTELSTKHTYTTKSGVRRNPI